MHLLLLVILEVPEIRGRVKPYLVRLHPFSARDGGVQGTLRLDPHEALFVVDAGDGVERAGVNRLRDVQLAAWSDHARNLPECLMHEFHRNVVQGFQHDRQIERRIGERNFLRARRQKRKPFLWIQQVLFVLDSVDFKPGDTTAGEPL